MFTDSFRVGGVYKQSTDCLRASASYIRVIKSNPRQRVIIDYGYLLVTYGQFKSFFFYELKLLRTIYNMFKVFYGQQQITTYSVYSFFYDLLVHFHQMFFFLGRVRMIVSSSLLDCLIFSGQFSTTFCIVVVVNNKSNRRM